MATTVFTVTFDQFKDHSLILDLLLLNKSFKHLLDHKLLNVRAGNPWDFPYDVRILILGELFLLD